MIFFFDGRTQNGSIYVVCVCVFAHIHVSRMKKEWGVTHIHPRKHTHTHICSPNIRRRIRNFY